MTEADSAARAALLVEHLASRYDGDLESRDYVRGRLQALVAR